MNSSPDIYENGRPELVEWELFQIVLDLTFLKERIPTKKQNQIFYWWVLSLGEIKFVDWKSGGGKWKWYWFDKYGADRPRWCAIIVNCSNYWTAIAGFFHRPVRKKGNLKGCQKCWDYLDIFALHYWTLIFASYSFTSGHPFLSFNIDWRISIFGGKFKIDTLKISCPKIALWPRIWGWML